MKFIDLFAGLGGFNLALSKLGHKCVFACEIDELLRQLYNLNFGISAGGDIRKIDPVDIPPHDILCAGFPCQPFSKAGSQKGFAHPDIGGLYKDILRIIDFDHPQYLILENVPNLQRHGNGETWKLLEVQLRKREYDVRIEKLSPHNFGIPQIRERIYIVGTLGTLENFDWPDILPHGYKTDIRKVLDKNPLEGTSFISQRYKLYWDLARIS